MKTMKKILLLLTFLCLLPMFSTTEKVHAEQNVTVLINGSPMQFDVPPVI